MTRGPIGGAALVARLRGGDVRAFQSIYDHLADRIYGFALRLAGRRDVADELFQHAWLRLAEQAPRLAPETNILAWLFTVVRNQHVSRHRRASTEARHGHGLAAAQPTAPRPDVSVERRALLARVEAALMALPEAHREVLVLVAEGDDVPQEELARVLGLRPEAFRKRLSRARRALRDALRGGAVDDDLC